MTMLNALTIALALILTEAKVADARAGTPDRFDSNIPLTNPAQTPSLKQWVASHQWKHRLILLYAPSASSPDLAKQRAIFAGDSEGLSERNLLVRELIADKLSDADRAYLQNTLNGLGNGFQMLLIGKDGGVKIRQSEPISLNQLYGTIDGMPMRRQEMKKGER